MEKIKWSNRVAYWRGSPIDRSFMWVDPVHLALPRVASVVVPSCLPPLPQLRSIRTCALWHPEKYLCAFPNGLKLICNQEITVLENGD